VATQQIEIRVLDKTQRALSNISTRLSNLNKGLLGVNRVAALAATALGAVGGANVISNIVKTTARFQDLRTTLSTVAGGAREGAEAFDFIAKFSTQTQFGVEELTQTFIKLKASGIEPTKDLLTLFTDAAAVTTDQLGSLQAITDLFSRTTAGGLGLEELNRLADRGIPVFDILQEKLGRNRLQLSDLGKTAEGANLILGALSDGIGERFGGATASRINNVSTQFSNLQIAIQNAADQIGSQGFAKALGETAVQLTNYIETNKDLVHEIGVNLTKAFLYVKEGIILVIKNIDLIGKAFVAFLGLKIALAVGSIAFAFGSVLVKGLALATRAFAAFTVVMKANPIIRAAALIIGGVELLTGAISDMASELAGIGGETGLKVLEEGMDKVKTIIEDNITGAKEFNEAMENIDETAAKLAPNFGAADEAADKLKGKARDTETATGKTNENLKEQANELSVTKKTFDEVLRSAEKQQTLALIALETDQTKQAIKKAELEIGRDLTDEERKQLLTKYESIAASSKQLKIQQEITGAANNLFNLTKAHRQEEVQLLEQGLQKALEIEEQKYKDGEILFTEFQDRKIQLESAYANEIERINKESLQRQDSEYMSSLQKRLKATQGAIAKQLSESDKQFLQRKGQEERTAEIVRDRIEFEKKSEMQKTQFALEQGVTMFEGLSRVNKKFFAAQKAAAIALAIVNTYQGATKALATYPPPFNFIAAAATVASGLAQVATIRAQTMQRGGALQGGQSAIVGEDGPELIVPKQSSTVIPREVADAIGNMSGKNEPVVVNFNISTVDAQGFDELLIRRRATITGIINNALTKQGKQGVIA